MNYDLTVELGEMCIQIAEESILCYIAYVTILNGTKTLILIKKLRRGVKYELGCNNSEYKRYSI